MQDRISKLFRASIQVKQAALNDPELMHSLEEATSMLVEAFRSGKKVLFCGNGGSAADAQHIAAELSGRFYKDRTPLFAEALHVNSSYITAVANDYGYDVVYSRLVEAMGREGDILVGISTSGNSANVLKAMQKAQEIGMQTIGMTGEGGGKMKESSDILLAVPSKTTPRIQEVHILIGHILCELVEEKLF